MEKYFNIFENAGERISKHKRIMYMLLLVNALILGILLGIGLCNVIIEHKVEPMEPVKVESLEIDGLTESCRMTINERIKIEKVEMRQDSIKIKQQEELEEILAVLQKESIHEFHRREAEVQDNENKRQYITKDLEEVYFFKDENEKIYFIPTSMTNEKIMVTDKEFYVHKVELDGKTRYHFYLCDFYKAVWKRVIYPEPYDKVVSSGSVYLEEIPETWYPLGPVKVTLPVNIPDFDEAFDSKLYENEYTDAIIELLHSLMHYREEYGEYRIYIGDYEVNGSSTYSKLGYNIRITATVVPVEGRIEEGIFWLFMAKDVLDERGKVIIEMSGGGMHEGNFSPPIPSIASYGSQIEAIVKAERLVLPLTVREEDEVREIALASDEDGINVSHYYLK